MEAQWIGGKRSSEMCVNHKNLTELLESYDDDTIVFKVGTDTKTTRAPLFIEDVGAGFSAIIQQMRAEYMIM